MARRLLYTRLDGGNFVLPVAGAFDISAHVLGLEPTDAPGYVEVSSPGAAVRWRVDHPLFGGGRDVTWIETGPASRAWAAIGEQGGQVTADRIWYTCDPIAIVDPADGSITDVPGHGGNNRALVVRYWPATEIPDGHPDAASRLVRSPLPGPPLVASTITRILEIPAGGTATLGYPPDRRHVLSLISDQLVTTIEHWGCISGGMVIGVPVLVTPPAQVHTRNVAPGVLVRVGNPGGGAATVVATWRSHTAIREV